jgi:hypothetical protein
MVGPFSGKKLLIGRFVKFFSERLLAHFGGGFQMDGMKGFKS